MKNTKTIIFYAGVLILIYVLYSIIAKKQFPILFAVLGLAGIAYGEGNFSFGTGTPITTMPPVNNTPAEGSVCQILSGGEAPPITGMIRNGVCVPIDTTGV